MHRNRGPIFSSRIPMNRVSLPQYLLTASPNIRTSSRNWFPKKWHEDFSTDRDFKENETWVENIRRLRREDDVIDHNDGGDENSDIGIIMVDHECSVRSRIVREVLSRYQDYRLTDLENGKGEAGHRRAAWSDDRITRGPNTGKRAREYQNPLTATALFKSYREKRFDHETLQDVDRRLVFIKGLDPYYILALGHTAPFHQMPALRRGFLKHLGFNTSISVTRLPRGYPIYQLELHLPNFELRELPKSDPIDEYNEATNKQRPKHFLDLSFLNPEENTKYCIFKARFSLIICGSDFQRWNGYGFASSDYDGLVEMDPPDDDYEEDPIAGACEAGENLPAVDANLSFNHPLEYYLVVFQNRIAGLLKEWRNVVSFIEEKFEDYEGRIPCYLSEKVRRITSPEQAFDFTQQALKMLRHLLRVLTETIDAWKEFKSKNGDIQYFSCLISTHMNDQSHNAQDSLQAISDTFNELVKLEGKLRFHEKSFLDCADALRLQMVVENRKAAQRSGIIAEFANSITNPVTLAATCFSMPRPIIPVEANLKSFLATALVMMLVLRLLFVIVGQVLTRAWGFDGLIAWLRPLRLDDLLVSNSAEEYGGWLQCMKGRKRSSDDRRKRKWTMSWRSEDSQMIPHQVP